MKRTRGQNESGTQVVELALVLPILLFLVMLVAEFAAFVRMHHVLDNAAREGVRLSSLQENKCSNPTCSSNSAIQTRVLDYMCRNGAPNQTCGGPTTTVAVNQNVPVANASGVNMTTSLVTVARPCSFQFVPAVPGFGIPSTITLRGAAQFRNLY